MNYTHLTINERTVIAQLMCSGLSIRTIAKTIQRNPSTISRELKRNSYKAGRKLSGTIYNPAKAQQKYINKNHIVVEK